MYSHHLYNENKAYSDSTHRSILASSILLSQPANIATLIHYSYTMAFAGLTNWSAILE